MLFAKIKNYWQDLWKGSFIRLFRVFPIKQNKIVFRSYHGTKYDDNPKYISDDLLKTNPGVEIVWLVCDPEKFDDNSVRFVREGSVRSIYELATAKIWVDNVRKDIWVSKRKKQYYIQTWHGGTALKKIEKDAEDKLGKSYLRRAKLDSRLADALVSSSKWNTVMYKRAFWFDGEILETGAPRSDPFYRKDDLIERVVKNFYNIPFEQNIVLYAPTFRNDGCINVYDMDYMKLINDLECYWGGKWSIIIRLHPNCSFLSSSINYNDRVLNGSFYPDINDLIMASSLLITDYSSCMFDAMEANKKVMLYASDIENYNSERGFYFQFSELPFSISRNNEELEYQIKEFDNEEYYHRLDSFKSMLGLFSDGYSSHRVVNHIIKRLID